MKTKKKKSAAGGDDVELEMTVGSDAVPAISREQKIELLSVALHTFDMMESVLGRVSELVDQAKRAGAYHATEITGGSPRDTGIRHQANAVSRQNHQ